MLVKVPSKDTATVVAALTRHVRKLPAALRRSLTRDRGLEMAERKTFTVATDVKVYFCDPQSPWQLGSNENTNELLRQYFPKKTDLSDCTQSDLDKVALRLNQRPRKTLGFQTPASKLQESVASTPLRPSDLPGTEASMNEKFSHKTLAPRQLCSALPALCLAFLIVLWLAEPLQTQTPSTHPGPIPDKGSSSDKPVAAGMNGVSLPVCTYRPNPPLTKEAKAAKFHGAVLADAIVELDGSLTHIRVLRGPGLGLDESVINTLKKWKCKAAVKDGKPVVTDTPFQFSF